MVTRIESKHQWIDALSSLSPRIQALNLEKGKEYLYLGRTGGKNEVYDDDALAISNSDSQNQLIVRAVEALHGRLNDAALKHVLGELVFRKTYGAFCELTAYEWLARAGIDFAPQVKLPPAEVMKANGSTLDGQFALGCAKNVFFDIKGFGFHDHKLEILRKRLGEEFPNRRVLIEGSWTASMDLLQDLLDHTGFKALVTELAAGRVVSKGPLEFRTEERKRVSIASAETNLIALAIANKGYPLRFAGQFTRNAPFILFFVIHPWFSQGNLHQNFDGWTDAFTEKLAELAFLSFGNDHEPINGVPKSELVKHLSGIAFLNVWPDADTRGQGPSSRIYLNPDARFLLKPSEFSAVRAALGEEVLIKRVTGHS